MNLGISVILSLLLSLPAYIKKSFTPAGLIFAFFISISFCICGGVGAYISLVLLYTITMVTDKIGKKKKHSIEKSKHEKGDRRDIFQLFDNLFFAFLCILIYKVSKNEVFYILFVTSLAVSASDTSASGVGILSKKAYHLLSWKKDEKGLSGNVSMLGFAASFVASFLIACTYLIHRIEGSMLFLIAIFGFLGAFLDSVLGCFQVKYQCMKCKEITEKKKHCGETTKYVKGLSWLNNDMVNFLSNLLTLIFVYIIFSL